MTTSAVAGGMLLPGGVQSIAQALIGQANPDAPIDRKALVNRHSPKATSIDPFGALTIGNGTFAFTADVTGLQSFPQAYQKDFPLCTTAHWAWHTTPLPPGVRTENFRYKMYDTHGRQVGYATDSTGQKVLFDWLRENPHRLHLGRVGLRLNRADGSAADETDLTQIDQHLDLWTGILTSRFTFADELVTVTTTVHPQQDLLAIKIASPLLAKHLLSVRIAFPYGSPGVDMANWNAADQHQTDFKLTGNQAQIARVLNEDRYTVNLSWNDGILEKAGPHEFSLHSTNAELELAIRFQPMADPSPPPTVGATMEASTKHWEQFWSDGAAVDFSNCTDPRASELERRVVLSQYNTALHCAGIMPPPETGLLFNSWYGKSHLEMHWWHAAHFAAWNRFSLLANSLDYYHRIMPIALATARRQGYDGARWPKMVDAVGHDSPSPIAPLLIWQQPHPIYYAELCYRHSPDRKTLEHWSDIVFESANFMASFAVLKDGRYVLGPPLKTVSENTETQTSFNSTFELSYWRFGLRVALEWRSRLGLSPEPKWAEVLSHLAPLPQDQGTYLLQENLADTYTKWNWEHPALLGSLGAQPGDGVETETMRRTLKRVMEVWDWDRCWGWDFPMAAMTAARLGEGELAVKSLLIDSPKNHYHPNGHVYQRPNLTAYLPANGGLLAAIATMVTSKNGFPTDGKWNVKAEGITPLL